MPTHRSTEYKVGIVALFSQPSSAHKGLRIYSLDNVQKLSEWKKKIEGRGNELACSVGPSPFHSHKRNKCFPALSRL